MKDTMHLDMSIWRKKLEDKTFDVDQDMNMTDSRSLCHIWPLRLTETDRKWLSLTSLDLTWLNLTWLDLTWLDLTWPDLTWPDMTWLDLSWLDLTLKSHPAHPSSVQYHQFPAKFILCFSCDISARKQTTFAWLTFIYQQIQASQQPLVITPSIDYKTMADSLYSRQRLETILIFNIFMSVGERIVVVVVLGGGESNVYFYSICVLEV